MTIIMQNNDEIKTYISAELKEEEEVLWAGRPEGVKLLEMPFGTAIIVRWAICLVILAVFLWYRFIFFPTSAAQSVNANVVLVVGVVIALFVALMPIMDIRKLNKKCYYYITNLRAISLTTGSSGKLKDKLYSDVSEISYDLIVDESAERGIVFVGKKLKNSFKKARTSALTPPTDEDKARPLVFYSVPTPGELMDIFPPID